MDTLIIVCGLFVASHMFLSSYLARPYLISLMGPWGFTAVYSLVAIAVFWTLLGSYGDAPRNIIWEPPIAFRHI